MKFQNKKERFRKVNPNEVEIEEEETLDDGSVRIYRYRLDKKKILNQIKELEKDLAKEYTQEELAQRALNELVIPEKRALEEAISSLKEQLKKF